MNKPAQLSVLNIEKNYLQILWTVVVLIAGAWLGALIGLMILSGPLMTAAFLTGPIGWLASFPLAMAQLVLASVGTFIIPLWAFFGGLLFSGLSASRAANGDGVAGVNLFSETHPIHLKTQEFATRLNLPPIKWVGWFDDDSINAFAMGLKKEEALIAFSRGAIERLSTEELDAVLGHELAHVANNDMSRMTYAYGVRNALTWFLIFRGLKIIVRWLFTPFSEMELMRFSRCREFAADKIGAQLTSNQAMISALQTIEKDDLPPTEKLKNIQHFAFNNPFEQLWSTHPTFNARVQALNKGITDENATVPLAPKKNIPSYFGEK